MVGGGDWKSRIVVVGLEECCDVIDGFIRSAKKTCVRCTHVEKVSGRRILDNLPNFLQLEVNCFRVIVDRIGDTGNFHTDIVEDRVKQYRWITEGGSCCGDSVISYRGNPCEGIHIRITSRDMHV